MRGILTINACILAFFLTAVGVFSNLCQQPDMSVINNSEGVELPILMYHSVLKDTNRSGKYIVTPSEVENDIKYLKSKGYTTVSMSEVLNFTEDNGTLPEKPVMLTFDDGCYNNYGYVLPLLEKYDARAVFCVVGEYTDRYSEEDIANLAYGYMRWEEIGELYNSPYVEIANHSYSFHDNTKGRNGSKKKKYESAAEYKRIFSADTKKAQSRFMENCGFEPYIYAYPFGAYSEESFDILEDMGFKATLSCNEGINIITRDSDCLYLLKRYNRPSGIRSADFFERLSL